jgi:hypothetical protein
MVAAQSVEEATGLEEIWTDDLLNRKADACFLNDFLVARVAERQRAGIPGAYVLNINAAWGEGKSYFLARFAKMLRGSGHVVACVNAWTDDHADDPLLSVMASIEAAVESDRFLKKPARKLMRDLALVGGRLAAVAAKGAVQQAAKKIFGESAEELFKTLGHATGAGAESIAYDASNEMGKFWDEEAKALLSKFKEGKRTIAQFQKYLSQFVDHLRVEGRGPLFVLIDELDRCRPPYALALLERVKHLFDVPEVVFIIATDTEQLQHAVAAVYGGGFDSARYLSRFFNRTYQFERPSRTQFVSELMRQSPIDVTRISLPPEYTLERCLVGGLDYCGLSLRDAQQVYDILRSVVTAWKSKALLEIAVVMPLVILQQQKVPFTSESDVPELLKSIANKNRGVLPAWNMRFGDEKTSIPSIFADFVGHSKKPLHDLNYSVSSAHSRWVVGRLGDEFQRVYGGRYYPHKPTFSIIKDYVSFVRSAGRLLPVETVVQ